MSTAPSPRSWSRSPPPTRSASGCGGCGRWRWSARAGRPTPSTRWRRIREILDDDLGLEPSPELRELQTAVLRQDPGLAWRPDVPPVPTAGPGLASQAPARRPGACPAPAPWPLVGREAEIAELCRRLDEAEAGVPAYVVLTGEPGIGKTRLCAELMPVAVRRGARVLRGRCSQDDGAPPLWPWQQVLRGARGGAAGARGPGRGRGVPGWESIVALVDRAARTETLVIVLDDLHWADPPTPRVLRLLAEQHRRRAAAGARDLAVPPRADGPAGRRRRGAGPTARLTAGAVGARPGGRRRGRRCRCETWRPRTGQAAELAARTDGNPFFLVEYARLARDGGDLAALLAEAEPADRGQRRPPPSPGPAARGVPRGAPLGGGDRPAVPARRPGGGCGDLPEDDVLDALDAGAGRRAGARGGRRRLPLRTRAGPGRGVRRVQRDPPGAGPCPGRRGVSPSAPTGRARCARHWLAAGPAHAGEAWRAARGRAGWRAGVHAHEQAAELLTAALGAWEADPAASPRDRYDLLMDLAEAHRWRGEWTAAAGDPRAGDRGGRRDRRRAPAGAARPPR